MRLRECKVGLGVAVKSGENVGRCGSVTCFSPITGTVVAVDEEGLEFFENYKNLISAELLRQNVASEEEEWLKPQHTFLITYRHGDLFEAESVYPATDVVDALELSRIPREAIVSIVRIK